MKAIITILILFITTYSYSDDVTLKNGLKLTNCEVKIKKDDKIYACGSNFKKEDIIKIEKNKIIPLKKEMTNKPWYQEIYNFFVLKTDYYKYVEKIKKREQPLKDLKKITEKEKKKIKQINQRIKNLH